MFVEDSHSGCFFIKFSTIWGAIWEGLGIYLGAFGAFLSPLGCLLAASWGLFGRLLAPIRRQNSTFLDFRQFVTNFTSILAQVWSDLGSFFDLLWPLLAC